MLILMTGEPLNVSNRGKGQSYLHLERAFECSVEDRLQWDRPRDMSKQETRQSVPQAMEAGSRVN